MMRRANSQPRQRGFTLMEVMIALAILAVQLTLLLRGTAANVAASKRAEMMTVATELARGKMYDVEELLLQEGYQETNQEAEGEFDEEGWPQIKWQYKVLVIELPGLEALQAAGAGGDEGGLGGLLGAAGVDTEGDKGSEDGGASAGIIGMIFPILQDVLEKSIRKVELTVSYRVAGFDESITVDCFFTDPSKIAEVIPNLGSLGGGGGAPEDDGSETEADSGSRPRPTTGRPGGGIP